MDIQFFQAPFFKVTAISSFSTLGTIAEDQLTKYI
jgi:hypothetical protein